MFSSRHPVEDGACVNSRGETPLHLACYSGHLSVVEFLLDKCCAVDALNEDGESALFYASRKGRAAVVRS
jgi:ankyrin repeat protein